MRESLKELYSKLNEICDERNLVAGDEICVCLFVDASRLRFFNNAYGITEMSFRLLKKKKRHPWRLNISDCTIYYYGEEIVSETKATDIKIPGGWVDELLPSIMREEYYIK